MRVVYSLRLSWTYYPFFKVAKLRDNAPLIRKKFFQAASVQVTNRSFPFMLFKGDEPAKPCHFLPNQTIRRNPEPHCLQKNEQQHCFRTFSEVSFETSSENSELSLKGSKVSSILRKSSDINLIPNLNKKE